MLRHVKHYKLPLTLTMLSMIALVAIQLVGPWLVRAMINAVTSPDAGPDTMDQVARLAMLALAVYVIRGVMRFIRSYSAHVAGWHVVADVRNEVYRHLQRLSLRFYEDKQTGQLMSRTVNDSTLLEQLVAHAIPDVLINILMLAGVSAILMSMSWQLALLSMMPIPLIVIREVRSPGLSSATSGTGRAQCSPERQHLWHPRDPGIHARGGRSGPHLAPHCPAP